MNPLELAGVMGARRLASTVRRIAEVLDVLAAMWNASSAVPPTSRSASDRDKMCIAVLPAQGRRGGDAPGFVGECWLRFQPAESLDSMIWCGRRRRQDAHVLGRGPLCDDFGRHFQSVLDVEAEECRVADAGRHWIVDLHLEEVVDAAAGAVDQPVPGEAVDQPPVTVRTGNHLILVPRHVEVARWRGRRPASPWRKNSDVLVAQLRK